MILSEACLNYLDGKSSCVEVANIKGKTRIRITSPFDGQLPAIVDTSLYDNTKLYLGKFISIATGVKFILGGNHNYHRVTTYLSFDISDGKLDTGGLSSNGDIIVENDVWIGQDVTIMSGVTVGNGSVIATGSIVTKDVEPYSIVGGIPAKIIKKRFNDDIINRLVSTEWWNLPDEFLIENKKYLFSEDIFGFLNKVEKYLTNNS
jgi:acetyltransferase-like isoleucine patch superfamily enzyme